MEFDFTHKSRGLPGQMDELGRLLLNVCTVSPLDTHMSLVVCLCKSSLLNDVTWIQAAPGGLVVFLPSYQYEEVGE